MCKIQATIQGTPQAVAIGSYRLTILCRPAPSGYDLQGMGRSAEHPSGWEREGVDGMTRSMRPTRASSWHTWEGLKANQSIPVPLLFCPPRSNDPFPARFSALQVLAFVRLAQK
eukprot:1152054-Pelagomonas_calceolata.AAC.4